MTVRLIARCLPVLPFLALSASACSGSDASVDDDAGQTSSGGATAPSGGSDGAESSSGGTGEIGSSGGAANGGNAGGSDNSNSGGGDGASNTGGAGSAGGAENSGGSDGGGGAEAAGGGDGSGGEPAVTVGGISQITVTANPNNVLSAFVSWTTDVASNSAVQFGEGELTWVISDDTPVTEHRVLVIGMKAERSYDLRAISTSADGTVEGDSTYTTAKLPDVVPIAEITAFDEARSQSGWTLMNVQKGDGETGARSLAPAMAVMYDVDGQPVWYFINDDSVDSGGATSVDLTDVGVLIGPTFEPQDAAKGLGEPPREVDFAGNVVWECPDRRCGQTHSMSHHAGKLENGNYIVQQDADVGGLISPVFMEFNPQNELVKSFAYSDFVPAPSGASGDWCHGNSITIDIAKDEVYMNCRWMGLVKTSYENPTFAWHIAATYGAAGGGDFSFTEGAASQFSDVHDPEIHDDGTILFFDNGGWDSSKVEFNPQGLQSRAVEYKIDEVAGTAELVWEFPGTFDVDPWYTTQLYLPFWGDADRLENGNVLITAGIRGPGSRSRVFEVGKADGVVVWEFQLPFDYGIYRSERIVPPLLKTIAP